MSTAQRKKRNRLDNDDEEEEEEEEEDSPKRLRGGGGGGFGGIGDDDDAGGDDLYDDGDYDDAFPMMEHPGEEDEDDDMMGDVAFGDITDAHRSRWSRPAVPSHAWNASDHDLNLQWLDIDMIGGRPLTSNPHLSKKVLGASTGTVPVIRLYGVNETGNSVAVFIHGFTSYGYFAMPRGYAIDGGDENLGRVRSTLDEILRSKLGSEFTNSNKGGGGVGGGGSSSSSSSADGGEPPRAVLGVTRVSDKRSIMGYDPSHTSFLKVYVAMPGFLPKLKTIMEEGMRLTGVTRDNGGGADGDDDERREVRETVIYQPFECNVPYVMRYMIDRDITGASWLTLPKGTYRLRRTESEKGTHCQVSFIHSFFFFFFFCRRSRGEIFYIECARGHGADCRFSFPHASLNPPKKNKNRVQIEADIFYNEIVPRKPEGEWSKVAPLRILSFDIECQGRKGYFPEAERDPVIQIANSISVYGDAGGGKPVVQNVFTLGGCLPIVGAQVISSSTEEDMLLKWRTFVHASDADIFTGYNVQVILSRVVVLSCIVSSFAVIHSLRLTRESSSTPSSSKFFDVCMTCAELRYTVSPRPCRGAMDEEGSETAPLHPVGTRQERPD